jgi:multiple sugar transport system substrate-binding protein
MARLTPALARCSALLIATSALCCACGGSTPRIEVLQFWAMGREAEVVEQLLPDFERTHPNLHIEVQQLPWGAAHQKLLTAFAGDSTPDLSMIGNSWIPEFVALNALKPLEARAAASKEVQAADYFDGIWQTNRIDGTLYGIPWYVDTRLLFYRSDLLRAAGFEAPATTWAGWFDQLQATKRLGGPERYAVIMPLNEFEPLQVLALQMPEPMLRDGNQYGNFRSASFRRALSFYRDLFTRQLAPAITETQLSNVWNEMGKGTFSFYISGPWNIGEFRKRLPAEQQNSWMTAPMPGPDGPGVSSAGGSSLVIFRRTAHEASAWALIEYLSSPAVQQKFYDLCGDLPPRRSSWQTGRISNDPYTHAFRIQLERLRSAPQVPEWEQIMQAMRLMAERVVRNDEDIDAATTALDAEVDAMLAKRRWLLARRDSP